MMYELKQTDKKADYPYLKEIGGFNELPTPYKESNLNAYFHQSFTYTAQLEEYRQVRLPNKGNRLFNARIYYFHDRAFALIQADVNSNVWVLEIGCTHKWQLIGQNFTLKQFKCEHCGMTDTHDTSGWEGVG